MKITRENFETNLTNEELAQAHAEYERLFAEKLSQKANDKMQIALPNGHSLVVSLCDYENSGFPPEIAVRIHDKYGLEKQAIAVIRARQTEPCVVDEDDVGVETMVWGDPLNENLTDKFSIKDFVETPVFDVTETIPTILTLERAKKLPRTLLHREGPWWLRTPSTFGRVYQVSHAGRIGEIGYDVNKSCGVRPAFMTPPLNRKVGDKVFINDLLCTVVGENLVLADTIIIKSKFKNMKLPFDDHSNEWAESDLKALVESDEFAECVRSQNSRKN